MRGALSIGVGRVLCEFSIGLCHQGRVPSSELVVFFSEQVRPACACPLFSRWRRLSVPVDGLFLGLGVCFQKIVCALFFFVSCLVKTVELVTSVASSVLSYQVIGREQITTTGYFKRSVSVL